RLDHRQPHSQCIAWPCRTHSRVRFAAHRAFLKRDPGASAPTKIHHVPRARKCRELHSRTWTLSRQNLELRYPCFINENYVIVTAISHLLGHAYGRVSKIWRFSSHRGGIS